MKNWALIGIATIALGGFGFAAEKHVYRVVDDRINQYDTRQIQRKIDFYIMKENFAPDKVTVDDKVNKQVLEKQLIEIKERNK